MGLDMYLEGRTYNWTDWQNPENNPKRDGFEIKGEILRLGYWRKHPDLHGYIVNTFADGVDDCKDIWLDADKMRQIIEAIKGQKLPETEGFFFGKSDGSEDIESIKIFQGAIQWLEKRDKKVSKNVYYQASW